MEMILEWASALAPWMVGSVGLVNLVMGVIKKLVDANNKLKPYWFWIALGVSLIASIVITIIMGNFVLAWGTLILIFAQFSMIFGTQLVTDTVMFKKLKPWIVKAWPFIKELLLKIKK